MSIFDHPKIREYFPCVHGTLCNAHDRPKMGYSDCPGFSAENFLKAMEEPIKNGDRYIRWDIRTSEIVEILNGHKGLAYLEVFIKIPDRFQTPADAVEEGKGEQHTYLQCSTLGCAQCIHYRQRKELFELAQALAEKRGKD